MPLIRPLLFFLLAACAAGQVPAVETSVKTAPGLLQEGLASYQRGDRAAALQILEEARQLADSGPAESRTRYEVLKALAAVNASTGEYEKAEQCLEIAMNWRERYEKAALVDLSDDRMELAGILEWRKQYDRALAVLQSVEQQYARQSQGITDPRLADVLSRQAQVYAAMGEKAAAVVCSDRSIRLRSAQLGEWHVWLTTELERLGVYALQARDYLKAEEAYQHAVLIRERAQGRDHIDLVSSLDGLAYALYGQKKHAQAEQVYARLLRSWTETAGLEHPMVILTLDKIASLYRDWGREEDAQAAEAKAIALRALFHANGLVRQAGELIRQKRPREALALYRKALALTDANRTEHAELRKKLAASIAEYAPAKSRPNTPAAPAKPAR
jgi:tetratricopeptide (TPR) repeat protein